MLTVLIVNLRRADGSVLIPLALLLVSLGVILFEQYRTIERRRPENDGGGSQQEQERVSQLATLNRILALLTDTLSPETVIDTVISSASTIGGLDRRRHLSVARRSNAGAGAQRRAERSVSGGTARPADHGG